MSSVLAVPASTWKSDALSLFQRLLPASFLKSFAIRQNSRVYTFLVVMWMLIVQRLQPLASLETAVLELLSGLPSSFWPQPCQRVQDWRAGRKPLSSHTGAYNKARLALPLIVAEQSCDRIFEQLTAHLDGTLPALGARAFFVDGTTVRMAHSPALCQAFPPGSNQHGEAHWPQLRMLVAHDLQTGLALRPEWGPVHGPHATSEQKLVETVMGRLPGDSVMVADANFGVFSVAYAAAQCRRPVVLRLTVVRAHHLAGGSLADGVDLPIVWKPTREDRRRHRDWSANACVQGRLIARQVQPNNGAAPFLLYLFATLSATQDEVLTLYGQRWNIETDLRSLKSTLQLEQLSCTTPEMVAKELNLAMAAYNLVRAITYIAAERAGIPPRGYSFTRVRNVIKAFTPLVANASSPREAQKYFDRMMYYVGQAKLPQRKKHRPSYPRAVWGKPKSFPHRRD
jgi:putative transposase